jgi:predicted transcriptional regulator
MVTETTDRSDDEQVLEVRVADGDEDPVEEAMKALDRGEEPERSYGLTLGSEDRLRSVLDDKNVELIRTIAREEPESIRELARLVDRDVRQVHDAVTELETLGLIELDEEGRAKKPTVWYDSISVDIPVVA